jgi:3-oxoacyl-[acyl-carrier protein] reductase
LQRGRKPPIAPAVAEEDQMHIRFDNRVALVAGGAQGIGEAIARGFADAGATVHVADVTEIIWAKDLSHIHTHRADLGQRAACHGVIDAIISRERRLDILVNAAGGVRGQVGRGIEEVCEADWRVIFEANVDSTMWLAQAASISMKTAGYGRIIPISSGAGLRPSLTGIQAYTAAKHALVGLTKQLSQDLGPYGITCNSVAPGFVRSNPSSEAQWQSYGPDGQERLVHSIHTRRTGSADDIAHAVLFLASEQAGWISGEILQVNGGRS